MSTRASDGDLRALERALLEVVRRLKSPRRDERLRATTGDDLERASYVLLGRIADGPAPRLSDLACGLGLDLSTVSRQVQALEQRGLVVSTVHPDDRRARTLTLTPPGRAALERRRAAWRDTLEEMLRDWPHEDVVGFTRLLERFDEAVGAYEARTATDEPGTKEPGTKESGAKESGSKESAANPSGA